MAHLILAWFDIVFYAVASAVVIVMVWAPLPRRLKNSIWLRERTLSTQLLYVSGVELMCLANLLSGITTLKGVDWWWWPLPFYAGMIIMLKALFSGQRSQAVHGTSTVSESPPRPAP